MQWNLRLPLTLRMWPEASGFLQALASTGGVLVQVLDGIPWITVELPEGSSPWFHPGVLQAEPTQPIFLPAYSAVIPQVDTTFSWAAYRVKADVVHSTSKGEGINIAVLDSGFLPHSEFAGADIRTVETTLGGDTLDNIGHGTLVLGLLASQGIVVLGTAPKATYHIIKVIDTIGGVVIGSDATVAAGVERARTLGANIISMSLGTAFSPMLWDSIAAFTSDGGVVVCAAGNSGDLPDHYVAFPASLPDTIAVGASDQFDKWALFSSWGSWPNSPDCVAPGVDVGSTYFDGYAVALGTSIATPLVAGCLALSMAAMPANWAVSGSLLDPKYNVPLPSKTVRARELLRQSSRAVGDRDRTGYGMVDAVRLTETFQPAPTVPFSLLPWLLVGAGVAAVATISSARR